MTSSHALDRFELEIRRGWEPVNCARTRPVLDAFDGSDLASCIIHSRLECTPLEVDR